jgi:hypothetical protein
MCKESGCVGEKLCEWTIIVRNSMFFEVAYCSCKEYIHVSICSALYLSTFFVFVRSGYVSRCQNNTPWVACKQILAECFKNV